MSDDQNSITQDRYGRGDADAMPAPLALRALAWQLAMGADEAISPHPVNRLRPPSPTPDGEPAHATAPAPVTPSATPPADAPLGTAEAQAAGRALIADCSSLDDLRAILEKFDGLAIRRTANNLVFADGNPQADVMIVGEAPGAEEDRRGLPFVGPSGQLLNRMLGCIGLDRDSVYIANTVYWRPPGNRKPNEGESAVCKPFLEKQIALVAPKILFLLGDKAVRNLVAVDVGITRSRGKWYDYTNPLLTQPVPALASFHPAYLLRNPAAKRQAWHDLLELQDRLAELPS